MAQMPLFLRNCHTLYISYLHPVNSKFSTGHYANFGARLYLIFWCGRTELKKIEDEVINKPSLVLSILDAVFTVSPNKQ